MAHPVSNVVFQVQDTTTSPNSWNTVGKVNQVPSVSPSRSTRDRTAIGDASRQIFTGGLVDPGQVTVNLTFDADENPKHGQLVNDFNSNTERKYRVLIQDGSPEDEIKFDATVQSIDGPSGGVDEDLTMQVTLQLTASPTFNFPTG